MKIGMDIHKESVYITAMDEDGTIRDGVPNCDEEWAEFKDNYMQLKPDIVMEMSTSGRCAARLLGDMGFSVYMADPANLALIFNVSKKNDEEDSYKLAKPLRLNELPEAYLPSKGAESMRALVRYRESLREDIAEHKNRIHAIPSLHGIHIHATDIFGRKGLRKLKRHLQSLALMTGLFLTISFLDQRSNGQGKYGGGGNIKTGRE